MFEKWGKIFAQCHPLLLYAAICSPLVLACTALWVQNNELRELERNFQEAKKKEQFVLMQQAQRDRFLERYSHCNPYFINKHIESLPLLQREKTKLQTALNSPFLFQQNPLHKRWEQILENQISFAETDIRTMEKVKEVDEHLRQSVQVDEEDLKKLLCLIEDCPIGTHTPLLHCPQMIIKKLHIKKRLTSVETETFDLEMDLLKREFQ